MGQQEQAEGQHDKTGLEAGEEISPSALVGKCYPGTCDDKGQQIDIGLVTKDNCRSYGGKSWVSGNDCYNL